MRPAFPPGSEYAIAQGQVAVAGFCLRPSGEHYGSMWQRPGAFHGTAIVWEVPGQLHDIGPLVPILKNPGLTTSVRIADAINAYAAQCYRTLAHEQHQRSILLTRPFRSGIARFIAIGDLTVEPDTPARCHGFFSHAASIAHGQGYIISYWRWIITITRLRILASPARATLPVSLHQRQFGTFMSGWGDRWLRRDDREQVLALWPVNARVLQ